MKKVLIIDDSPFMTQMFGMRLHDEGFESLVAGNGEDALKIAANEQPDIILTDLAMSPMSGWVVLEKLKSNEQTKDIPVIVLTNSKGNSEDIDRAKSMGAVEFLMKIDLKVDDIMEIVKKYV